MKEKYNSYSEFSKDFFNEHPELFDRTGVKIHFTLELDTHSDMTEDDIRSLIAEAVMEGQGIITSEGNF